jgi:hypothetical protein
MIQRPHVVLDVACFEHVAQATSIVLAAIHLELYDLHHAISVSHLPISAFRVNISTHRVQFRASQEHPVWL